MRDQRLTADRDLSRQQDDAAELGAVLPATTSLTALVYGLSTAATHGWSAPLTPATLTTGLILAATFVTLEARSPDPLLPLSIVAHRIRSGAYLAFILVMLGMFARFLLVSLFLQSVAGYTALQTGLAFLPFAGAVLIASTATGRLAGRIRSRLLLTAGLLLAAAGMAWLTQLEVGSGYPGHYLGHLLPALLLFGAGLGTISPVAANLSTFPGRRPCVVRLFRPHRRTLAVVTLLVGLSSLVSVAAPAARPSSSTGACAGRPRRPARARYPAVPRPAPVRRRLQQLPAPGRGQPHHARPGPRAMAPRRFPAGLARRRGRHLVTARQELRHQPPPGTPAPHEHSRDHHSPWSTLPLRRTGPEDREPCVAAHHPVKGSRKKRPHAMNAAIAR
jgi:hypothetical protein